MTTRIARALGAALAAAVLAACGGGGGGDASPASALDAVPEAAGRSTQGLVAYLQALSALRPDDREPLDLSGWLPPASETEEPVALKP